MDFRIKNHRLRAGTSNVKFVASPNVGGELKPRFLVIHYTASGPDADIARYFAQENANVSAHLVIRRDGSLTQCVPFNVVAWHAGKSQWIGTNGTRYAGLNDQAIGIEIENWGALNKSIDGWITWTGAVVDGSKVIEARHKFGTPAGGWEVFNPAQVEAAIAAARAICTEYAIEDIVGHDDIAPGRKSDPGPAWDMDVFKARVRGEADNGNATMVVRTSSGLNIRCGPGATFGLLRPAPLPDGTKVVVHEAQGRWRYVSVLDKAENPDFSGWVHGDWLFEG